ncbi:MAG: hypothetical protein QHJ81_16510, partial [Anaerolineae bacterium]|nr:hypothetical protein [Anaerolineae bacterium]
AHNLFLQLAIEQGVFGLLAFVWLLGAFFWSQLAGGRRQEAGGKRPIAIRNAAMWAVVVIVVHGLVDATLYASRTLPFLFVPFGLAVASQRVGESANRQIANRHITDQKSAFRNPSAPFRTGSQSAACGERSRTIRIPHSAILVLAVLALGMAALVAYRLLLASWYANLGAVRQTQAELAVYEWPKYPLQDAVRREQRDALTPAV